LCDAIVLTLIFAKYPTVLRSEMILLSLILFFLMMMDSEVNFEIRKLGKYHKAILSHREPVKRLLHHFKELYIDNIAQRRWGAFPQLSPPWEGVSGQNGRKKKRFCDFSRAPGTLYHLISSHMVLKRKGHKEHGTNKSAKACHVTLVVKPLNCTLIYTFGMFASRFAFSENRVITLYSFFFSLFTILPTVETFFNSSL